jgi:hypothetical protein
MKEDISEKEDNERIKKCNERRCLRERRKWKNNELFTKNLFKKKKIMKE